MDRFLIFMDRGIVNNEMYVVGLIQGLVYGMCAIPNDTTLWDCEVYASFVMFPVDCTEDHVRELVELINKKYPGLCRYDRLKEGS